MKTGQKVKAGVLIFLIPVILVLVFPFSRMLEDKSIDMRMKLRGQGAVERRIVIISIDEESFRQMDLRWPWPRTVFADLLDRIGKDSPLAVGIDVEFSEKGFTPENDAALASAMERYGNIVIPEKLWTEEQNGSPVIRIDQAEDMFLSASAARGYVNLPQDSDGFVRRVISNTVSEGKKRIPFAFAVAKTAEPSLVLPEKSPLVINFAGGVKTFLTLSFSKVLAGELGDGFFRDKIVLVGAGYRESGDFLMTPFTGSSGISGVEIHANIVNTLLTNQLITDLPVYADYIIFLVLLGILTVLSVLLKPGWFSVITGGIAVIWFTGSAVLFSRLRILVPMADILLMLILVTAGSVIFHYITERNRRREINSVFSRFVSPAVVKQLINTPNLVRLGGEIRTVTLLFSDIRGFTTRSERMNPEEVVNMLNDYFTAMSEVLFANEGTLNKFIGDAIFAFFGAPTGIDNTAERAVRTSLQMREALKELNKKFEMQGKKPIKIGIGLHKGEVLVGNIGSERQMEYTVIGDNVNVCSRIESYTKEAKTDILISDTVYQKVKDSVKVETMPPVILKGKREAVTVHKLIEGKL